MIIFRSSYTADALLFIGITLFILYKYVTRNSDYWRKRNVPGPPPKPFVGNLWDFLSLQTSWGSLLKNFYASYDAPFVGIFTFDQPVLLLRDPKIIKNILTKDFDYFQDRVMHQPDHNKIFGKALFVLKNPQWKTIRAKLTPAFSSGKMKDLYLVANNVCQEMISYMKSSELDEDCKDLCKRFSTEMITQAFFGIRGECFAREDSIFFKISKALVGFTVRNALVQAIYFFKGTLVPIFKLEFFQEGIIPFFKDTFWKCLKNVEKTGKKPYNFISLLESYRKSDKTFDDENVLVAQGLMFFTAGIETVSSSIAFTLYELSMHNSIQENVRSEIRNIVREKGLNYDSLKEMHYLEMCLQEALRKYPPLPFLDRICHSNYKIPGTDIVIEKNTPVYISILGLQYDEKYFPEPEKFIPERHERNLNDPNSMYLPFGSGPRACIGERFGMVTAKLALAHILMNFSVEKVPKTPTSIVFDPKCITLFAKGGLPLTFKQLKAT